MTLRQRLTLGAYIGGLDLGLPAVLVSQWPGGGAQADGSYLICAAAAGALGSCIHTTSSFIEHAGNSRLVAAWGWWYVMRPWIGALLAVVVYFVVRAGLIAGATSSTDALNPYGVAAMASLSGMFSHQATQKLREIFENICTVQRRDAGE